LIGLAEGLPEWGVGFLDETWFSRLARAALNSWSEVGEPLRLVEHSVEKDDPDPKAISSCYGLYVPELEKVWVRFVDGRPVSSIKPPASFGGAASSFERRARRRFGCWSGTTLLLAHLQRGQKVDRLSQP
jgi:hypothetical protein